MKKKIKGIVSILLISILIAGALSACSKSDEGSDKNTNNETTNSNTDNNTDTAGAGDLSGEITMAGSTSMEKLATAAAEAFTAKYPDVMVSPEFTGSSAGIEALSAGTVDIGNSSRSLTEDEKSKGLVENIVAIDGIAVITHPSTSVTDLSKEQLVKIYTGEIKNWSELGGSDQAIVVLGREAGSGTRDAYEELLGIKDLCKYSNEINSTGAVLAKTASTPGAIGYVSLDVIDESVKVLKIDDVEPTEENIKAGSYLLSRPFVMATKGQISEQNEVVQEFFKYMTSDEGKELIKSVGLITVD